MSHLISAHPQETQFKERSCIDSTFTGWHLPSHQLCFVNNYIQSSASLLKVAASHQGWLLSTVCEDSLVWAPRGKHSLASCESTGPFSSLSGWVSYVVSLNTIFQNHRRDLAPTGSFNSFSSNIYKCCHLHLRSSLLHKWGSFPGRLGDGEGGLAL